MITTLSAAEIAQQLHGKRCGESYQCRCPAHFDANPSLSIRESREGKILVHCHAGCSQEAVIAALRGMGLWSVQETKRIVTAEYDYINANGELIFQVCRTEPKGFFQRKSDGHGGWINHGPRNEDKVLYRLREVIEAPIVFVVEGERDVNTLRDYGFHRNHQCCRGESSVASAIHGGAARTRGHPYPR